MAVIILIVFILPAAYLGYLSSKAKRKKQFKEFRKVHNKPLTDAENLIGQFFIEHRRWGLQRLTKVISNYKKYEPRYFNRPFDEVIKNLKSYFPRESEINGYKLIYLLKENNYLSVLDGKIVLSNNLEVFIQECFNFLQVNYPEKYRNELSIFEKKLL